MKKVLIFLFAALVAISSVTPAYAYHHGRHHRSPDYRGSASSLVLLPPRQTTRGSWAPYWQIEQALTPEARPNLGVPG